MYTGFTLSVCLSVCPSVCRRNCFRSVTQVGFEISISNFICMLFVAMGRSLLKPIDFQRCHFKKMAAWRPDWIFRFPDSNFSSALNIKSKLHWHVTCVYGRKSIDFQRCHFQNGRLEGIFDFSVSELCSWHGFWSITQDCFGVSISNFICMFFCGHGPKPIDFQLCHCQNGRLAAMLDFSVSRD